MKESLVSISLITYNGEKYIKNCLNSILNQSYNNIESIVIDNASVDRTVEIISEVRLPNIRVVLNEKNLGFAAGHNIGIKESGGEFVLCLNQDVILDKDFIKEAIEVFRKNDKIGAVQGKLFQQTANKEQGTIDTTGLVIFKNRRVINRGQGEKDIGQYDKIEEVFGVDGAAPIYRKETLEDVKLFGEYFDEDFFAYKEDIDLSWRLRLFGWKIVYNHKSIAWHKRKAKGKEKKEKQIIDIIQSRKELPPYIQYYSFKNQRLMQIKNELPWLFLKHLPWILPKEIASWLYVLFFERKTWPVIGDLFRQIPTAWHKRKIIMANKKVGSKEMERWFQ